MKTLVDLSDELLFILKNNKNLVSDQIKALYYIIFCLAADVGQKVIYENALTRYRNSEAAQEYIKKYYSVTMDEIDENHCYDLNNKLPFFFRKILHFGLSAESKESLFVILASKCPADALDFFRVLQEDNFDLAEKQKAMNFSELTPLAAEDIISDLKVAPRTNIIIFNSKPAQPN